MRHYSAHINTHKYAVLAAALFLLALLVSCTGSSPQDNANAQKSGSGVSGDSVPAESVSADTTSSASAAAESVPESSMPAESVPEASVPEESVPEESVPDEPKAILSDAADAVWVNDTVYDFQDIAPIWAADFSDFGGKYMEGSGALIRQEAASANRVDLYELAAEAYSPIDEYYLYLPADSDVWRFFHMPSLAASADTGWAGEAQQMPGSGMPYLSGADGILYGNSPAGREAPWDLLLFGSRISGTPALVYDEVTGSSYLYVQSQMGDCAMRQLAPDVLHKPYRANAAYSINHAALPEDTSGLLLWQSVDANGGYYPQGTIYTPDSYVEPDDGRPVVFIGTDAKPLSLSRNYTNAGSFSYGYAAVEADGKWGYIDEAGQEVIPCRYDAAPDYGYPAGTVGQTFIATAYPVTDETAVVFRNGECGLIAMDGTLLIGFGVFEDMAPAFENQLWVKTAEGWRLLDLAALKAQM